MGHLEWMLVLCELGDERGRLRQKRRGDNTAPEEARFQAHVRSTDGGVKHREVSRRPPRDTRCRIWVRGGHGRVGVEGLESRASAATSGEGTVSAGRRWSEMVAHASARRETLYGWPPGSGTCRERVTKAARECGTLGTQGSELH
ncbi:hypothetical protein EDB89DRAFT_1911927 [Lactarius sanguifluus]|nr:hypothetical protein EDB89DRAFT_1911927 [Lactarius sanguifluus]